MMAEMVLIGVQPSELPLMSFSLMRKVIERRDRQRLADSGDPLGGWNPDTIPDYENPDGPPTKSHFVAYGVGLGVGHKLATELYERQVSQNGVGRLPESLTPGA